MIDENLERFIRYVKIDTQSDDNSSSCPSSLKQLDLARLLMKELDELGIKNELDKYGRVYAHLPGEEGLETIGLNSHMDTALEASGKNVKPQIIENYDGGDIALNSLISMSPKDFPSLSSHKGDTLVVTSGNTLLGGDDKAGIAIIMSVLAYYVKHPEEKHHPIAILFTPDEEIGRGPEHFNLEKFGATYAYTIDGDYPNRIDIENFNGAHADVLIKGIGIHPGEAKGKMVNAARLAVEFDHLLNDEERPEFTDGYDGFNHLSTLEGDVNEAKLHYILRNHDSKKLQKQKREFYNAAFFLEKKYPNAKILLSIKDDYRNMKEIFDKDPRAIDRATEVFTSLGITPTFVPIRGGTDGATFSFLGCPTPNLGTGSYNHHGIYEYLSLNDFRQMIEIVRELVKVRKTPNQID